MKKYNKMIIMKFVVFIISLFISKNLSAQNIHKNPYKPYEVSDAAYFKIKEIIEGSNNTLLINYWKRGLVMAYKCSTCFYEGDKNDSINIYIYGVTPFSHSKDYYYVLFEQVKLKKFYDIKISGDLISDINALSCILEKISCKNNDIMIYLYHIILGHYTNDLKTNYCDLIDK